MSLIYDKFYVCKSCGYLTAKIPIRCPKCNSSGKFKEIDINPNKLHTGVIDEYDNRKKYGFIIDKRNKAKYFFHSSDVTEKFRILPQKTVVTFKLQRNEKGLKAVDIKEYKIKIEGEFSNIALPNITYYKNNEDRIMFLKEQQKVIEKSLEIFSSFGMNIQRNNDWITIDTDSFNELKTPRKKCNNSKFVPSGYPETASHILKLIEKQVNDFNYDLHNTQKGILGERKCINSLCSVSLSYPVIQNLRLGQELFISDNIKNNQYSAEIDVLIITDRALFVIEIKNYGTKKDKIIITKDGKWLRKTRIEEKYIENNPFKQIADHIFLLDKFLASNNLNFNLPIIPIIAIANDSINLEIEDESKLFAKIMPANLIGTYVLKYHNDNQPIITNEIIQQIFYTINNNRLPPNTYPVLDYGRNICELCFALKKLIEYWSCDVEEYNNYLSQKKEEDKIIREEKRKQQLIEDKKEAKTKRVENIKNVATEAAGAILALIEYFYNN